MAWIPKPNFENVPIETKPRFLTDIEINNILAQIPSVRGVTKAARDAANKVIRQKADIFLHKIEITPIAIPELIDDMIRKFERSRVVPETAVGISAAEAIGRTATQTTLNSFHVSGSSKNVSYGLEGLKEMINATKNRKNLSCTIVFKDKTMGYLETLRKRRNIVGITVGRLMNNYEIDEPKNLEQFSWHKTYPIITGKRIPQSEFVMRIYLDLNIMFQHQVTMERICNIIEERNPGLSYIHSPVPFLHQGKRIAIIDIYPQENIITEVLSKKKIATIDRPSLIFLKSVFLPSFESLVVQGIPGISAVYSDPIPCHVMRIIRAEVRAYPDDHPDLDKLDEFTRMRYKNIWLLLFNKLQMRITGIGKQNLEKLFSLMGIMVYAWTDDYVTVEIPIEWKFSFPGAAEETLRKAFSGPELTFHKFENKLVTILSSAVKPKDYIQKIVSMAEQAEIEQYDSNKKKGIYLPPLDDPIIQASRFFTLETTGTNLRDLLSRDDVDTEHTFSNDFHEITHVLGVDAAKCFYIRELMNIIVGSDSYVESRHVRLIADFVFNQGRPLGLTFAGISRQPISYLDLASFQKSVETFSRAALYGRSEKIIGTSSSIYVGKRIGIGTGAVGLDIQPEYKKKYEEELKKRSMIDAQVLEHAVEDLDEQTFGNEDLQFTGEYDEGINNLQEPGILQTTLPVSSGKEEIKIIPLKGGISGGIYEGLPTTTETLASKAPTVSLELLEVLKMLSTAPAYPNAGSTRLHISPLRYGLAPPPTLLVKPETPIEHKDLITEDLPAFTFIEPMIKEEITESIPSLVTIKDDEI